jgi:hypothetical protein
VFCLPRVKITEDVSNDVTMTDTKTGDADMTVADTIVTGVITGPRCTVNGSMLLLRSSMPHPARPV